jgi:hypothetical protein
MSPSDGLERLKNWQRTAKEFTLASVDLKGPTPQLFDVRVRVAFVDESRLVFVALDRAGEAETLDLRGARFATTDELPEDLEIIFSDGKSVYLHLED